MSAGPWGEIGPEGPWIPTPEELDQFRKDLDVALSSEFRMMVLSETVVDPKAQVVLPYIEPTEEEEV